MAIFPALSKALLTRSLPLTATLVLLSTAGATPLAQAQVTPDATLGNESSTVTPDVLVRGSEADLIEGGALRGSNLFHSFLEFNVDAGQRLYFVNPAGVESILSRITGDNPSAIFGTLGVDGAADLFLINPNGLVFGETATLDIQGSFYASTAEAIPVGDGVYSATAPEQSSLLTVNPSALFSNYLSESSGNIESQASLAVGENLTLAANRLNLQRQVAAGGDLTLLGNTVEIRDAVNVPFIGFARGDLLVQGNEQVDIVALSHPDSGLYSYGDMVLRSANPVGGDAHYWSGGNFRVENLEGSGGGLFSPIDPIIRSLGDVFIEGYSGSSLHILAMGAVRVGTAEITAPDPGALEIDSLQETVTLSDGTVVPVDGGAQPTLDVRAGVRQEALGTLPIEQLTGFNPNIDAFFGSGFTMDTPSSADITIGDVLIAAPSGLVLLTNQYQPNPNLIGGNITVTGDGFYGRGIDASRLNDQGSAVYLDARGDVSVISSFINTISMGNVGDVVINAAGTVRLDGIDGSRTTGIFTDLAIGEEGSGGNVFINAANLEVLNGARIDARVFGSGQGGNVFLNIRNTARFVGLNPINGFASGAASSIEFSGKGQGGNVQISARNLEVLDGAQLNAGTFGAGNAGSIILDIKELARLVGFNSINGLPSGIFNSIEINAEGQGGNIEISAQNLEVLNGAQLVAGTFGIGNSGSLILEIEELVRFVGFNFINSLPSGAFSNIALGGEGQGGDIRISAQNLEVLGGAQLVSGVFGRGKSGSIILEIEDLARFVGFNASNDLFSSGAFSNIALGGEGQGGDIRISARKLEVLDGAQLNAATFGIGNAGSVILEIGELARFVGFNSSNGSLSGAFSNILLNGKGQGGNVRISAQNLDILDGARLVTNSSGWGNAGSVILEIENLARFVGFNPLTGGSSGAFSNLGFNGIGKGGNVQISARNLEVLSGAQLSAGTFGLGDAGSVILEIEDLASFVGFNPITGFSSGAFSNVQPNGQGMGGNIQIAVRNLEVIQRAALAANSLGIGDAGNIVLDIAGSLFADDADIVTNTESGSGGQVTIQSGRIILRNNSDIQTFVDRGEGGGGNITIASNFLIALEDSDILAFSADGRGGAIDLSRTTFFGQNPSISVSNLSRSELPDLDGNDRVDINATGGIESGQIFVGDATFVENSLTALTDAIVDTSALTAGSCIARSQNSLGAFVVTGGDGLPSTPGDGGISAYPTGTVRALDEPTATRLQEPDGVYQLPDGRLVLGRACD
ncbi:filamentous hemagglutinin N-terminal domain-containing protein [Nodosilinea sp. FACHB-13]|uniref:two-partner secretion domain-containing protein n=1 Tax=Cyanophyceae TaxID=3028117 RepID=UPI0016889E01|nr:filamentous hemagglutinin N-terminal domain-containing protein [Nodosilinea sp. FACHB-13]MBD2108790.1 filamentous hemagglutinin N-terminal domain-containing protein [Nodosilinea sp. FACHB-13]